MEYKILNTIIDDSINTTITTVEFNIEGNIVLVDVYHFKATQEIIQLGINNRYITEMYKLFPERMPPASESPIVVFNDESNPFNLPLEGEEDQTW